MANDRQPRQQQSERAQTSVGSVQKGQWQPSQRGSSGQQGGYSQESQTQSSREMTQRSEPSHYPGFGPFSMMRRLSEDIDRMFENFGMGRSFFPTDFWLGGRETMMT